MLLSKCSTVLAAAYWAFVSIKYEMAQTADAAEAADATVAAKMPLDLSFHIPDFEQIQGPYPASADKLNEDATYSADGQRYTFVGLSGELYVFDNVDNGTRTSVASLTGFQVLHDPQEQVEKDIEVILRVKQEAERLFLLSTTHVDALCESVSQFRNDATATCGESSEEALRHGLEKIEQSSFHVKEALDFVKRHQAVMQTILTRGLNLCEDLQTRAKRLTNRPELVKRIESLHQSLKNENAAVSVEAADYKAARQEIVGKVESVRSDLRLLESLQDVQKRYREYLKKSAEKRAELEGLAEDVENLTSKVVSKEEVHERRVRANTLKSQYAVVAKRADSLDIEVTALMMQFQHLRSLHEMSGDYSGEAVQALNEEIKQFQELGSEVNTHVNVLQQLLRRTAAGIRALKDYAESYAVLESDLLQKGLHEVRTRLEVAEAKTPAEETECELAKQALEFSIQVLSAAVNSRDISNLQELLQAAKRQLDVYVKAATAAAKRLDLQEGIVQELRAEIGRLKSFVTNAEDGKELKYAEQKVAERISRLQVRRRLVESNACMMSFGAALEETLNLPFEMANKSMSDAEAKIAESEELLPLTIRDASVAAQIFVACHEIQQDITTAKRAFEKFQQCRDVAHICDIAHEAAPGCTEHSRNERLVIRASKLHERAHIIEASVTRLIRAIKKNQASMEEGLVAEVEQLISEVSPRAAELSREILEVEKKSQKVGFLSEGASFSAPTKQHAAEAKQVRGEAEPGRETGSTSSDLQRHLDAAKTLRNVIGMPDFDKTFQTFIANISKSALSTAAERLQSAMAAQKTALLVLEGDKVLKQEADSSEVPLSISPDVLASSYIMFREAAFARTALSIFERAAEVTRASEIFQALPYDEERSTVKTIAVAAQELDGKARSLSENAVMLSDFIVRRSDLLKLFLDGHLTLMLQSLDAGMARLEAKKSLIILDKEKVRIIDENLEIFETSRAIMTSCMSASPLLADEASACISLATRHFLSNASVSLERAQALHREAEVFFKHQDSSSPANVENAEKKIINACARATEELEFVHIALEVYVHSIQSSYVKAALANASGIGTPKKSTLSVDAEDLNRRSETLAGSINKLRENFRTRHQAFGKALQTRMLLLLSAAQRGLENIRNLTHVEVEYQRVFVDNVVEVEEMLALMHSGRDTTEMKHHFDAKAEIMMGRLLALGRSGIETIKKERAHLEPCVRGNASCAALSLSQQEEAALNTTCENLFEILKVSKTALGLFQQYEAIAGNSSFTSVEKSAQQLLAESASLEQQLHSLCDEIKQQFDAKLIGAQERLKFLRTTIEEVARAEVLLEVSKKGDPLQTLVRLQEHLTSLSVLQSTEASPKLLAAVAEKEKTVLRFLFGLLSKLLQQCSEENAAAASKLNKPNPSLVITTRSEVFEILATKISRSQSFFGVATSVATACTVLLSRLPGTIGQVPFRADVAAGEGFLTFREKEQDCRRQAEGIAAEFQALQETLSYKMQTLRHDAALVLGKLTHIGEQTLKEIHEEEKASTKFEPACESGDGNKHMLTVRVQEGVSIIRNLDGQWGTDDYAVTVQAAAGNLLITLLDRARTHLEAGEKKTGVVQMCLTSSDRCEGRGANEASAQANKKAYREADIMKRHTTAAKRWLLMYEDATSMADTKYIASRTVTGKAPQTLSKLHVRLSSHLSGLESMTTSLQAEVEQRLAVVQQLVSLRLRPVVEALKAGIQKTKALDEATVSKGNLLETQLENAVKGLQELQARRDGGIVLTDVEPHVGEIFRVLATHASDLIEESIQAEKHVTLCLRDPDQCPLLLLSADLHLSLATVIESIAASVKTSFIALQVLRDSLQSAFSAGVANRTPFVAADPSSMSVLQRVSQLWQKAEELESALPRLTVLIKRAAGEGSHRDNLAHIVELFLHGWQKAGEVNPASKSELQEEENKVRELLEKLRNLHGAVVPRETEAGVKDAFQMAVEEAQKQVSTAKKRHAAAQTRVDGGQMLVVTGHSTAAIDSSATGMIDEGFERATLARDLLAAVDQATDVSGKLRATLERVAGADKIMAAEQILAEAEASRLQAHLLRATISAREEALSSLAAQSTERLLAILNKYSERLDQEAATRGCLELVASAKERLRLTLGMLEKLRQDWKFPLSLGEYIPLIETCVAQLFTNALTSVREAKRARDEAKKCALQLEARLGITEQSAEELKAQTLCQQGKHALQVARISLDSFWAALAADELKRFEEGKGYSLDFCAGVKDKFMKNGTDLVATVEEIEKQLNIEEIDKIRAAERKRLARMNKGRIDHVIQCFERSLSHLAGHLEALPSEDEYSKMQVDQLQEAYSLTVAALTVFRSTLDRSSDGEALGRHVLDALSTIVKYTEQHLIDCTKESMHAAAFSSVQTKSAAPEEDAEVVSQAETAISRVQELLFLTWTGLDTFKLCTSSVVVAQLAETGYGTPGGLSYKQKIEELSSRASKLEVELTALKDNLLKQKKLDPVRAPGSSGKTADDQTIALMKVLLEEMEEGAASSSRQDLEAALLAGFTRRLDSAANKLQDAEEKRKELHRCIADEGECGDSYGANEEVGADSRSAYLSMILPIQQAERDLKVFKLRPVGSEHTLQEEDTGSTLEEGQLASATLLEGVSRPVCAVLRRLDPSLYLTQRAEKLLAARKDAEEAAGQTGMRLRAVQSLRRLLQILDETLNALDDESEVCRCGDENSVMPLKSEYRIMRNSLTSLLNKFDYPADMEEYVQILEGCLQRFTENGKTSVDVAKQAAELAEDVVGEMAPAEATILDAAVKPKVGPILKSSLHHLRITRIVVNSLFNSVKAARVLRATERTMLYDETTALMPLIAEAENVSKLADRVQAKIEDLQNKLDNRERRGGHAKAKASLEALIATLEKTVQRLDKSLKDINDREVTGSARAMKVDIQALRRILASYIQEPNFPEAHSRFEGTVVAVGRTIIDHTGGVLQEAERIKNEASACVEGEGLCILLGTSAGEAELTAACAQMEDYLALSDIALDGLDACHATQLLAKVLSKRPYETYGQTSISERGVTLKEKAEELRESIDTLRVDIFRKANGLQHDLNTQKNLLSKTVADLQDSLKRIDWRASSSLPVVVLVKKYLKILQDELVSTDNTPQQAILRDAAVRLFQLAIKLTSELVEEGQQRQDNAGQCMSVRAVCVLMGYKKDQMGSITEQTRIVCYLMDLAKAALRVFNLSDSEEIFAEIVQGEKVVDPLAWGATADFLSPTLQAERDGLAARIEQLHTSSKILKQAVLQRESAVKEECSAVLKLLLKALYTAVHEISAREVPDEALKAKKRSMTRLSNTMESLQDMHDQWDFPESFKELRSASASALVLVIEIGTSNIAQGEVERDLAAKMMKTFEPNAGDADVVEGSMIATMNKVEAYIELAEAALKPFFTCAAHEWLRRVVTETPYPAVEGEGRERQISVNEQGETALQRLKNLQASSYSIGKRIRGIVTSDTEVAEKMLQALQKRVDSLVGPEFQVFPVVAGQKRAAFEARMQLLKEAIQQALRQPLETAVTDEVLIAFEDLEKCLAGTKERHNIEQLQDQMNASLKNLLEAVDVVRGRADAVVDKCGGDAEAAAPKELSKFFKKAQATIKKEIEQFGSAGKALKKAQQEAALGYEVTKVYCDLAQGYVDVEGIEAPIDDTASSGRPVPSLKEMKEMLEKVAPGVLQERQDKAASLAESVNSFETIATRENGKLEKAIAMVVPIQLDRLRLDLQSLIFEEEAYRDKLGALIRITQNVLNKQEGRSLNPPSGVGADVGLPNEIMMTPLQLLREATTRQAALAEALKKLSSKIDELGFQIDKLLSLLLQVVTPVPRSPFGHQRRLSERDTLEGARPLLLQMQQELKELKARVSRMEEQANEAIKKASAGTPKKPGPRAKIKSTNNKSLPLALGLGLPLAILLVGGCAYYHCRRRRKRSGSAFTTVGSHLPSHESEGPPSTCEDIQVSRYDFGEPEDAFVTFEPPAGIKTLTTPETPEAGHSVTTRQQYMVDEHHVVAQHVKQEAVKQEQQFQPHYMLHKLQPAKKPFFSAVRFRVSASAAKAAPVVLEGTWANAPYLIVAFFVSAIPLAEPQCTRAATQQGARHKGGGRGGEAAARQEAAAGRTARCKAADFLCKA